MINLETLSQKLKIALENETDESLQKWFSEQFPLEGIEEAFSHEFLSISFDQPKFNTELEETIANNSFGTAA